ncbi:GntR family transcriptional regulator [Puniceibacterium confluentis]|uniref:GntR family transcriptional regulator n=1 Tax=Puniceibacterium confluentis TaxID=1958944 RepID=UPI0011B37E08|nr:GntR family transcriptional regulator [Puniceibacterium confluentis]
MSDKDQKTTRATMVYDRLRREILTGQFRPSEKLRIDAIADSYGVGNNAVREALSRLAAERLVDRHERRGFTAPAMGIEDWQTLARTRCLVESLALRESMNNRTDAWEERIVVAYHHLSKVGKAEKFRQNLPDWNKEHRNFHRALIANCGSHWLLEFCDQLADQAERYIYVSNIYRMSARDGQAEHRALMEVVLDGDIVQAEAALVAHYSKTLIALEELFQTEEFLATLVVEEVD